MVFHTKFLFCISAHYADGKPVSQTLKNTAETVSFFDDLFDSVNGASLFNKSNKGKALRKAVTANSTHHTFWKSAIQKLEKIKYIDKNGKETSVPSLKNWVQTLKSYERLWKFFHQKNINVMRPRNFNSDPIENFFGQVRAYNIRNTDPNCHAFVCTYKSLLITRFIKFHAETFNCEDDSGEQLIKIKTLFENRTTHNDEANITFNENIEIQMEAEHPRRQKIKIQSRAYTVGWIIRKIMSKNTCDICSRELTTGGSSQSIHNWIAFKEYSKEIKHRLTYPSEQAVRYYGYIVEETNNYLEITPHKNNISKDIKKSLIEKYYLDFLTCESHKAAVLNIFLQLSISFTINNWCNIITKILKGVDISRLNTNTIPPMQLKAYNKYFEKQKSE